MSPSFSSFCRASLTGVLLVFASSASVYFYQSSAGLERSADDGALDARVHAVHSAVSSFCSCDPHHVPASSFSGLLLTLLLFEDLPVREGTLEGGLHLHLTELAYGEIQVLQRLGLLVRVVHEEQLGKLKPGEGKLSARTPPAYRGR